MIDLYTPDYKKICKPDIIREISKPILAKGYREQVIMILDHLRKDNKYVMKKDIKALFPEDTPTAIERYIDALEFTGAITSKPFATSLIYEITPIGYMMYEVLNEE